MADGDWVFHHFSGANLDQLGAKEKPLHKIKQAKTKAFKPKKSKLDDGNIHITFGKSNIAVKPNPIDRKKKNNKFVQKKTVYNSKRKTQPWQKRKMIDIYKSLKTGKNNPKYKSTSAAKATTDAPLDDITFTATDEQDPGHRSVTARYV